MFENIKVTWQGGASPHVIFRKATGEEISREPLTDLSAPELVEFLEKRGLKARKRFVAPPPKDAQVSFEIDGVPYKFYERAVYRSDADAKAKEEGGVLVGFPTRQEHDAIVQKLKELVPHGSYKHVWTQAWNSDGMWFWGTRTETDKASVIRNLRGEYPWAFQEPSSRGGEECAVMNAEGKLEDVECHTFTANVLLEFPRKATVGGAKTGEEL